MIKNTFKAGLLALVVFAGAGMAAGTANAANLTFTSDQAIDLSGADLEIVAGSEADSLVVNATNIQVTVGEGDQFTVTSDTTGLNVGGATSSGVNNICAGSAGTATIEGGPDGETITLSGTGIACDAGGSSSGGGGSSNNDDDEDDEEDEDAGTPVPPVAAPTKPLSEMTIPELQAEVARIMALIADLKARIIVVAGPGSPAACAAPFSANLAFGMQDSPEVARMQEFMIGRGHLAAGLNTGNYFSLTANAVGAYQLSKGISPVPGSFGPLTRAAANADCGL